MLQFWIFFDSALVVLHGDRKSDVRRRANMMSAQYGEIIAILRG